GFFVGSVLLFVAIAVGFSAILMTARTAGSAALQSALIERTTLFLFLFLLASGVPFVSGVLLAPGDLPLLAAAPVRPVLIVFGRLVDAVAAASGQFVVIGVPLLVAAAWVSGLGAAGWLAFLVLLALFLVLPAVGVAALLLLLARAVGVRRVKVAVAITSAVLALVMCLVTVAEFSQQASQASRTGGNAVTRFGIQVRLDNLPPPAPKWLPSTWVSDALAALRARDAAAAARPFVLLLWATLALGALCVAVGGPVLVGESLLEGDSGGRKGDDGGSPGAFDRLLVLLPLAPPVRALLAKDARYVVRDLVLLSQVGIPVILYFVPFVIAGQVAGGVDARQDLLFLALGVVATIAYMEASILGLSSIGLEGRAFWLVLAAPVTSGELVRAKFLSALLPTFLLCAPLLLVACLWFGATPVQTLLSLGVLFCASAALCGLGVGIAGLFPRFVYENPAHRASLMALVWGFVGATAYVILSGLLVGGGAYLSFQWREMSRIILAVAGGAFLLLSVATAALPLAAARARLDGFAWEEN
ncbi:MAG TPA: hypothetical protein VM490_07040, partial [Armatimonadaceae bacterium]|nr:hypothetical protein [Armatimonadaceae bacterium]